MSPWLDYPTQVSELEKMARQTPSPAVVGRALPELVPAKAAACLVCGARPARVCAACGSVSYCGVEHQRKDARWHEPVCSALRAVAEDQRASENLGEAIAELRARGARSTDLRALRGWDDYFGTDDLTPERRRRLTDLATRPLTLANMVIALELPASEVLRVHVMAASQREADVPHAAWAEAARLLGVRLELALVGPELPDRPTSAPEPGVAVQASRALYDRALWSELGRPDLIIGYDCGLMMYPSWKSTILDLRGSGVPFVITTFRVWEAAAEARLLSAVRATCLLAPKPNPWATLMGKRSSTIANDLSFDNAYVSAWR